MCMLVGLGAHVCGCLQRPGESSSLPGVTLHAIRVLLDLPASVSQVTPPSGLACEGPFCIACLLSSIGFPLVVKLSFYY